MWQNFKSKVAATAAALAPAITGKKNVCLFIRWRHRENALTMNFALMRLVWIRGKIAFFNHVNDWFHDETNIKTNFNYSIEIQTLEFLSNIRWTTQKHNTQHRKLYTICSFVKINKNQWMGHLLSVYPYRVCCVYTWVPYFGVDERENCVQEWNRTRKNEC